MNEDDAAEQLSAMTGPPQNAPKVDPSVLDYQSTKTRRVMIEAIAADSPEGIQLREAERSSATAGQFIGGLIGVILGGFVLGGWAIHCNTGLPWGTGTLALLVVIGSFVIGNRAFAMSIIAGILVGGGLCGLLAWMWKSVGSTFHVG
jgi:hypothetical protein